MWLAVAIQESAQAGRHSQAVARRLHLCIRKVRLCVGVSQNQRLWGCERGLARGYPPRYRHHNDAAETLDGAIRRSILRGHSATAKCPIDSFTVGAAVCTHAGSSSTATC